MSFHYVYIFKPFYYIIMGPGDLWQFLLGLAFVIVQFGFNFIRN